MYPGNPENKDKQMEWEQVTSHYKGTRVVVLGSTGFIGIWLARKLCSMGAKVYLFHRDAERARRLYSAFEVDGEYIEADLLEAGTVEQAIHDIRPAVTFNLAGYGVNPEENNKEIAHALNVRLVERLADCLETARDRSWQAQALVHTGSGFEYGAIGGDLDEESIPDPTSLYATTKLKGTKALVNSCNRTALPALIARPFTVYGPGESSHRLLPSLMKGAQEGGTIQLSSGVQKRDFIYVEDVVEGIIRLAVSSAPPGTVVNLASGVLMTVRQFVEAAATVLGITEGQLQFSSISTRVVEMEHLPVNINRLQSMTDWTPSTSVQDGVRRTLMFFQSHKNTSRE